MPSPSTKTALTAHWKVLVFFVTLIALLAYALHYHGDLIAVRVISYVLYGIAAMNFVIAWYRLGSSRHFGRLNAKQKRTVRELNLVADNPMLLYASGEVLLLGAGVITLSLFNNFHLLPLGLWVLSTYLTRTLRMNQPPLVLLLTTSSETGYKLVMEVYPAIHPHRAASMLVLPKRKRNFASRQTIREATLRTVDDDIWRRSGRDILALTRIVVLDSRHVTPAITEEARLCLSMEYLHKVVIVVGANNEAPLLTHVQDESESATDLVNKVGVQQDDLWGILWYLVRWSRRLPTESWPMQQCLEELPVEWRYVSKYTKDGQHIPLGRRHI